MSLLYKTDCAKGSESSFADCPPQNRIIITRNPKYAPTFLLSWAKQHVLRAAIGSVNKKAVKLHRQLLVTRLPPLYIALMS